MTKKKGEPEYQHSNPEHLVRVLKEFLSGSDRECAIVGAALVDDLLEQALRSKFVSDSETTDRLFRPDMALGSFSVKTDLSFALGIIGPITNANLKKIRDVRNKFAHKMLMLDAKQNMSGVGFETQKIADLCKSLKPLEGWVSFDGGDIARTRYAQMCVVIVLALKEYLEKGTVLP